MSRLLFVARDLSDTDRLGAALAQVLPASSVISLVGTLGAGKTYLVQALASALGVARESVVSPTFVLCQEYQGSKKIVHVDAYRLRDEDEFLELGPQEWFESEGLTLIEWADRVESCLPVERLEIRIEVLPADARQFEMRAIGESMVVALDTLRASI
ncbi:MAG: tRNA (adenosine(37)-N6)-threonylcarbamoyltransferase complex ATPase subunit type 1 TsaE [Pirellulales bacterium]|jgi:tRNA threonylcarbamoyladenosine biosynthesis protein TsaE|nr:tRNA (adenosine(37)-N6)-threonylcarbamoyltransferase complex ATPase subunit type 1 TsaE [Pirellulales bacterium]